MVIVVPLLVLSLAMPAAAATPSSSGGAEKVARAEGWVVIVRADGSIPEDWASALRDAAKAATSSTSAVRYVPPPEISTKEVELALGCQGWTATCAGQVATMLSAQATLTVDIVQRGRGAWLSTELVGADGRVRGERTRHELPDRGETGLRAAKAFISSRITGEPVTALLVDTDVPGADVVVDGSAVGKTPVALYDVAPGRHTVVIDGDGRPEITRVVDVTKGEIAKVAVVLSAPTAAVEGQSVAATPVDDEALMPPGVAYAVLGTGGAFLVVAALSGAANLAVILSHQYYPGIDTQKSYMSRRVFGSDENASAVSYMTGIGFYVMGALGLAVGTVGAVLLGVILFDEGSVAAAPEAGPSPPASAPSSSSDAERAP